MVTTDLLEIHMQKKNKKIDTLESENKTLQDSLDRIKKECVHNVADGYYIVPDRLLTPAQEKA